MSKEQTLFDMPLAKRNPDDFFDKLEEVNVEFGALLPASITNQVAHLVECYQLFLQEKEKLSMLHKTLLNKAESIEKTTLGFPAIDASLEELKKRFRSKLITLFSSNFPIDVPSEFSSTLAKEDFEFSEETILSLFMEHTNNGDTSTLLKNETMKKLGQYVWPREDGFKLSKNKLTIPSFYWIEHCNIYNEKKIGYSSSNWQKPHDWKSAMDLFAMEQEIDWNTGSSLFLYYREHDKDKTGAFEKQTFEAAEVLTSTKLFKNGKMELHFKTDELAATFYNDWITPAKEL